ncbi:MAG: type II toxin-antitoxin system Phd/YefM family antitoxin [Pseudomonadota bacterium]
MAIKFSEDVVRLSDLKVNPGRVVQHAADVNRPVLLPSRGRGVAVMQALPGYEAAAEEREFMRAVVAGLADIDTGQTVDVEETKRRFSLG